jgi:hypothetical protein
VKGRETGAESETERSPEKTRPEAKLPVEPEPKPINPAETRPPDEPRLDFRQAEARLPVDLWPVVPGAISGGSVQKSGNSKWRFSGEISGAAQRCFPVNSSYLKQKFLMISCAFVWDHC